MGGRGSISPTTIIKIKPGKEFNGETQANKWLAKNPFINKGLITYSDELAVEAYQNNDYSETNRYLRGLKKKTELNDSDETEQLIKRLDNLVSNSVVPVTLETYRGIRGEFADQLYNLYDQGKLKPGSVMRDKAYVSVSLNKYSAMGFAGSAGVLVSVTVPKGTKALNPQAVSGLDKNEQEVMLGRDQKLQITEISKNSNGMLHVKTQVI
jgi:hypothetical protein